MIDENIEKAIELAFEVINDFPNLYKAKWMAMMRAKLGLLDAKDGDEELISDFLNWMQRSGADYTNSFRGLSDLVNFEISEINLLESSGSAERAASRSSQLEDSKQFLQDELFFAWLKRWQARICQSHIKPKQKSDLVYSRGPREAGPSLLRRNFKTYQNPKDLGMGFNSRLVESSLGLMKKNNPAIIPRNHKVEEALNAAIDDDLSPLFTLLEALKNPYQDNRDYQDYKLPPNPSETVYQTFCGT